MLEQSTAFSSHSQETVVFGSVGLDLFLGATPVRLQVWGLYGVRGTVCCINNQHSTLQTADCRMLCDFQISLEIWYLSKMGFAEPVSQYEPIVEYVAQIPFLYPPSPKITGHYRYQCWCGLGASGETLLLLLLRK